MRIQTVILFQYLCRAHHGMLAAIETMEENNYLKSEAAARKGKQSSYEENENN